MNDRRMMKTTLLILTVLFFSGVCPAQIVELDLQKCRKMAVENSKKLQSAEQQGQKAGRRRDFQKIPQNDRQSCDES